MNTTPINDGGPAYPLQCIGPDFPPGHVGMTLRDYFAANIQGEDLKSMVPKSAEDISRFLGITISQFNAIVHYPMALAKARYMLADAMLVQRSIEKEKETQ